LQSGLFRFRPTFLKHDYVTCLDPKIDTFRFSEEFLKIKPKVVTGKPAVSIIAAIDEEGRYLDKTVHMIVPKMDGQEAHCPRGPCLVC